MSFPGPVRVCGVQTDPGLGESEANAEVIRDGENGFLPDEASAWVENLDALLRNPSLAASIGDAGRRTVERTYSLEVVSRRLIEILEDIRVR